MIKRIYFLEGGRFTNDNNREKVERDTLLTAYLASDISLLAVLSNAGAL